MQFYYRLQKGNFFTKFGGESYEFNFSKFAKQHHEKELPNEDCKIEKLAAIVVAPNDPLQQFMEDHESEVSMQERNKLEDIFLRQPTILKHNLPMESLGMPTPPKGDPVFELKILPDDLKYASII